MDEMPHQDMLPGGYSGNHSTASDVLDGTGVDAESEDNGEELIDFSAEQT
jgi:hypothetical protein